MAYSKREGIPSADGVWHEVVSYARDCLKNDRPVKTVEQNIENKITDVEEGRIGRLSARGNGKVSWITRGMVAELWSKIQSGDGGSDCRSFAKALVLNALPGVVEYRDGKLVIRNAPVVNETKRRRKASLAAGDGIAGGEQPEATRAISPEEIELRLKQQNEVGRTGEEIARQYEVARLTSLGAKNAHNLVEHVAKINTAAGFDLRSNHAKKIRYIEVKSSIVADGAFFISTNEIKTLKKHGSCGYIYLVHITDVPNKVGQVTKEIRNPFSNDTQKMSLDAVLYHARVI